jgi:hypothetical protein
VFEGAFGDDKLFGFSPGAATEDRIQLTGLGFTSFNDVLARTTLGGAGAVISVSPGNTISLFGVAVTSLAADASSERHQSSALPFWRGRCHVRPPSGSMVGLNVSVR